MLHKRLHHMEGTFQSSLSPKLWETLHALHSLPCVKALARHGDPDLNTAGLRQKATLALLSCLGFPQASQCHTKGQAASVSVEGTANVSTRVDTDWVLSQPYPRQQPSTLPPTSTHRGSPAGCPASKPHRRVRCPLETQPVPPVYQGQNQERTQLLKSTYLPEAAESQRAKARSKMSASKAGQHRLLRTGEQLLSHSCAALAISSWGHWVQLGGVLQGTAGNGLGLWCELQDLA